MQVSKAPPPILVTELGIVTEVRPRHQKKALSPILVTELGIVIDVKPMQSAKALSPILVTEYSTSFTLIEEGIVMSPSYLLSP